MNKYKWKREISILICLSLFVLIGLFFVHYSRAQMPPISESISATVKISVCGDNITEGGEECDGSALDGQSCITLGFSSGSLSCDSGCAFDTSACVSGLIKNSVVIFSGKAYPLRIVTLLKDGQIVATGEAEANGDFQITISGLSAGSYAFSLYVRDRNDNKSKTIAYQTTVAQDETKHNNGIIFAPTIETDEDEI